MSRMVQKHPQALIDLIELADYLSLDDERIAWQFVESAEQSFDLLATMPNLGRAHASGMENLHVWHVHGFDTILIFYTKRKETIDIIRVLHAKRDIENLL